jgi:hypothetical protein
MKTYVLSESDIEAMKEALRENQFICVDCAETAINSIEAYIVHGDSGFESTSLSSPAPELSLDSEMKRILEEPLPDLEHLLQEVNESTETILCNLGIDVDYLH